VAAPLSDFETALRERIKDRRARGV
jgi:hypothetical protein